MGLTIFITFIFTIITFHVNHQLKKFNDIRIIINTLFEIFRDDDDVLNHYSPETVHTTLSYEILQIEKMHDANSYVEEQMKFLRQMRNEYYNRAVNPFYEPKELKENLSKINFKRLGRGFTILAYLNIRIYNN